MENNQLIEEFKTLSPEEKIGKTIALVQQINDASIDSDNLITYLATYPLSGDMLIVDQAYENILNLMKVVIETNDQAAILNAEHAKNNLNILAQQSIIQHDSDESQAENLLSNI